MPSHIIYSDTDGFAGGVVADMAGSLTPGGNTWVRTNPGAIATIGRNAANQAHLTLAGAETAALYLVSPTGGGIPSRTGEARKYVFCEGAFSMPAAAHNVFAGLVLGMSGEKFDGHFLGYYDAGFPAAVTSEHLVLTGTAQDGIINPPNNVLDVTIAGAGAGLVLHLRLDPYQAVCKAVPGGASTRRLIVPDPDVWRLAQSESAFPHAGLVWFESPLDVNRSLLDPFVWGMYEVTPRNIYPAWREYYNGQTLIEVGDFDFGSSIATAGEIAAGQDIGPIIINIPLDTAGRRVTARQVQVINRTNIAPVQLSMGPFRWRVGGRSDAEIPLPKANTTDPLIIDGGGSGTDLLIYGDTIPLTFRQ